MSMNSKLQQQSGIHMSYPFVPFVCETPRPPKEQSLLAPFALNNAFV